MLESLSKQYVWPSAICISTLRCIYCLKIINNFYSRCQSKGRNFMASVIYYRKIQPMHLDGSYQVPGHMILLCAACRKVKNNIHIETTQLCSRSQHVHTPVKGAATMGLLGRVFYPPPFGKMRLLDDNIRSRKQYVKY